MEKSWTWKHDFELFLSNVFTALPTNLQVYYKPLNDVQGVFTDKSIDDLFVSIAKNETVLVFNKGHLPVRIQPSIELYIEYNGYYLSMVNEYKAMPEKQWTYNTTMPAVELLSTKTKIVKSNKKKYEPIPVVKSDIADSENAFNRLIKTLEKPQGGTINNELDQFKSGVHYNIGGFTSEDEGIKPGAQSYVGIPVMYIGGLWKIELTPVGFQLLMGLNFTIEKDSIFMFQNKGKTLEYKWVKK